MALPLAEAALGRNRHRNPLGPGKPPRRHIERSGSKDSTVLRFCNQGVHYMKNLQIVGLFHDTGRKLSFVTVQWQDDPEKQLGLAVPFGCQLDDLKAESEKAIKALAKEIESATVIAG
jgi:hypothetical protein